MDGTAIVISVLFGVQFLALAFGFLPGRIKPTSFYHGSAILMWGATGVWIGDGSWNATWTAALAMAWMWAHATQPARDKRRQEAEVWAKRMSTSHLDR